MDFKILHNPLSTYFLNHFCLVFLNLFAQLEKESKIQIIAIPVPNQIKKNTFIGKSNDLNMLN